MKLFNYEANEYDIGFLLNNEEAFFLARKKLRPETYVNERLSKLVSIMIEVGPYIEKIYKIDKEISSYAKELSNMAAMWTMSHKHSQMLSAKDTNADYGKIEDYLKNYAEHKESQSFIFLLKMLNKFLHENKKYKENRQALRLAKENFEHYCKCKEILND